MAVQKQDDQHGHTFSSYVRIRDVVLKTCLGRWTIGRSGERGSGISVLPARHDDDDDDFKCNEKHGFVLIIIIIILSYRQYGYPWPSLATSPYRSSLLAGPQGYIPYPHRAAVCRIELVSLLLLDYVRGSIGEHQLWARPCFSSIVLVRLTLIVFVMWVRWPYSWCFVGCCLHDLFIYIIISR